MLSSPTMNALFWFRIAFLLIITRFAFIIIIISISCTIIDILISWSWIGAFSWKLIISGWFDNVYFDRWDVGCKGVSIFSFLVCRYFLFYKGLVWNYFLDCYQIKQCCHLLDSRGFDLNPKNMCGGRFF